jgi:hypothetical protein
MAKFMDETKRIAYDENLLPANASTAEVLQNLDGEKMIAYSIF